MSIDNTLLLQLEMVIHRVIIIMYYCVQHNKHYVVQEAGALSSNSYATHAV